MSEIVPDGWVTNDFSEIASNRRRKFQPKLDESEVVYVGLEHLESEARNIKEFGNSVDVISTKTRFFRGDTLFGKLRPYLKKVAYPDCDGICSTDILAIKPTTNTDSAFLYYVCSSDAFIENAVASSAGNIMPRASWGDLATFPIRFPPLSEQKKIASILTSVDKVIENTQKQIDKLQDLKKATMNELLTKGIGHTQFKDSELGRIPKSWEVVSLSKVATNLDSKRIPLKSSDRQDIQGIYRYFGASGVIDYVNDYLFDGEYILLGEDGENVISRNLPLAFIVRGKFWVNNHAHIFQPINGVNIGFLCEYLESLDYTNVASGSAQPKITKSSLNGVKIKLPSFEEQKKIAHVLTSIDKNIREQQRKLHQTKSLKKSLMQDLLTGKVRVKI